MSVQHRLSFAVAALLVAAPALAQSDPAARAWLAQQLAAYQAGSSAAPSGAPNATAQSLATWEWLRRAPPAGVSYPLAAQAQWLANHPGWPGYTAIRRRAETQAADPAKSSDGEALAFFRAVPPATSAGQARHALLLSGPEALAQARAAWARPSVPPELESALLARFGSSPQAAKVLPSWWWWTSR